MNRSWRITPENQAKPEDGGRGLFLEGVMQEAMEQGYGTKDKGRLFVVALRAWEGR